MSEDALAGLAERFARARRAAMSRPRGHDDPTASDDAGELERRTYENCHALGRSFARFYGDVWAVADLPRVLPALDSPCADGVFSSVDGGRALLLLRPGCSDCGAPCGVWRESLAGLVRGATGRLFMARHESRGTGGERCVDAFYADPECELAFGPVPVALEPALASVARQVRAFDSTARLSFLGINENVLYYRLERPDGAGLHLRGLIERGIARQSPGLLVRELATRQVFS